MVLGLKFIGECAVSLSGLAVSRLRKVRFLALPLAMLMSGCVGLPLLAPTEAQAQTAAPNAVTGGNQTNTGGNQTGATVTASGGSRVNIALCIGCSVVQVNANGQSVVAGGASGAATLSMMYTRRGEAGGVASGSQISYCVGCNVTATQTNAQGVTGSGGSQSNVGANQVGPTVNATGGARTNIAICIGCNVIQTNINIQTVTDATGSSSTAVGGNQTNKGGSQTGAVVSASGGSRINIAECFGCAVSQTNVNSQFVGAADERESTTAVGGNQLNIGGSQTGATVMAVNESGVSIARCYGCSMTLVESNGQNVEAASGSNVRTVLTQTDGNADGPADIAGNRPGLRGRKH
jgi:hypothetical protein